LGLPEINRTLFRNLNGEVLNLIIMALKIQIIATLKQKENFTERFAEIVKNNENLKGNYRIQFFNTSGKSNYVFNGLDGKSMNILSSLSLEELNEYRTLKSHWQN
jgi:hypothetical protein